MPTEGDILRQVKDAVSVSLGNASSAEKVNFYCNWAENYEKAMEYHGPKLVADNLCQYLKEGRDSAVVLDVACGTGLVAKELKKHGFGHFVGVDGSKGMLEMAKKTNLYQDLKLCMLGDETLPIEWGSFDVVTIVGSLSVGHVPAKVVKDLCKAAKPGGYVCMTARHSNNTLAYKRELEHLMKQMEEEKLWSCVLVAEEKDWLRKWDEAEQQDEEGEGDYVAGTVYIYKKL